MYFKNISWQQPRKPNGDPRNAPDRPNGLSKAASFSNSGDRFVVVISPSDSEGGSSDDASEPASTSASCRRATDNIEDAAQLSGGDHLSPSDAQSRLAAAIEKEMQRVRSMDDSADRERSTSPVSAPPLSEREHRYRNDSNRPSYSRKRQFVRNHYPSHKFRRVPSDFIRRPSLLSVIQLNGSSAVSDEYTRLEERLKFLYEREDRVGTLLKSIQDEINAVQSSVDELEKRAWSEWDRKEHGEKPGSSTTFLDGHASSDSTAAALISPSVDVMQDVMVEPDLILAQLRELKGRTDRAAKICVEDSNLIGCADPEGRSRINDEQLDNGLSPGSVVMDTAQDLVTQQSTLVAPQAHPLNDGPSKNPERFQGLPVALHELQAELRCLFDNHANSLCHRIFLFDEIDLVSLTSFSSSFSNSVSTSCLSVLTDSQVPRTIPSAPYCPLTLRTHCNPSSFLERPLCKFEHIGTCLSSSCKSLHNREISNEELSCPRTFGCDTSAKTVRDGDDLRSFLIMLASVLNSGCSDGSIWCAYIDLLHVSGDPVMWDIVLDRALQCTGFDRRVVLRAFFHDASKYHDLMVSTFSVCHVFVIQKWNAERRMLGKSLLEAVLLEWDRSDWSSSVDVRHLVWACLVATYLDLQHPSTFPFDVQLDSFPFILPSFPPSESGSDVHDFLCSCCERIFKVCRTDVALILACSIFVLLCHVRPPLSFRERIRGLLHSCAGLASLPQAWLAYVELEGFWGMTASSSKRFMDHLHGWFMFKEGEHISASDIRVTLVLSGIAQQLQDVDANRESLLVLISSLPSCENLCIRLLREVVFAVLSGAKEEDAESKFISLLRAASPLEKPWVHFQMSLFYWTSSRLRSVAPVSLAPSLAVSGNHELTDSANKFLPIQGSWICRALASRFSGFPFYEYFLFAEHAIGLLQREWWLSLGNAWASRDRIRMGNTASPQYEKLLRFLQESF
eukprot:ANDGO_06198.mRNA.1 hypothetical protein